MGLSCDFSATSSQYKTKVRMYQKLREERERERERKGGQ